MRSGKARAFAPAAISNFFAIHDEGLLRRPPDLRNVGATGGGYTLSAGVETLAFVRPARAKAGIALEVNGDSLYPGKTTLRAAKMLLGDQAPGASQVVLKQTVQVPIGYGFGASAASALSAVMAMAEAMALDLPKAKVAYYAHAADILCHTGLGTVSSTFDHTGAGLVVKAGAPGVALVEKVELPDDTRIVTAAIAPFRKSSVLLAPKMRRMVNVLGERALSEVAADPCLTTLGKAGESFSRGLGLMTEDVSALVRLAKKSGALFASQNMIGHAIHALVPDESVRDVVRSMKGAGSVVRVDVFAIGTRAAVSKSLSDGH